MKSRPFAVTIGAAVVVGAGVLEPLRRELGILAERDLPADGALVQIDGVERAPRRLDGGIAVVVEEDVEARVAVRAAKFGFGSGRLRRRRAR